MTGPTPRSVAYALQGQGVKRWCRPEGRSGWVTTPTIFSSGDFKIARSAVAEASEDPMKTMRMPDFLLRANFWSF